MKLFEDDAYNAVFPANRIARVAINTKKGERFESGSTEARGDPEAHLSDTEIRDKFHQFTTPLTGKSRAWEIETAVDELGSGNKMGAFLDLICS